MANYESAGPDLLEVTSSEGTLVMDCNIGMALISIQPERESARTIENSGPSGRLSLGRSRKK